MTNYLIAILVGAAIPLVTFVVLNLKKPDALDKAEEAIRKAKK